MKKESNQTLILTSVYKQTRPHKQLWIAITIQVRLGYWLYSIKEIGRAMHLLKEGINLKFKKRKVRDIFERKEGEVKDGN